MPAARGLFHAAIPESGAASWYADRERGTEIAQTIIDALGVRAGDLDALYAKTTDEIITAQAAVGLETSANGLPFQPVVDGTVLPRPALDAIADGNAAGVRLLVGTNHDEMTLFSVLDPTLATMDEAAIRERVGAYYGPDGVDEFLATYRRLLPGSSLGDQWNAMATDALFRVPAIRLAEHQLPHAPVWSYLFTWESPAFGGLLKSTHAVEIPFVFDTLDQPGSDMFTGTGPERAGIARRMHDAWTAFARDGAPGHAGIPGWPQYDTTRRATMRIDDTWEVLDDPMAETRKLWDGH
jgi:para-nitrobenzyl esterase